MYGQVYVVYQFNSGTYDGKEALRHGILNVFNNSTGVG